MTRTKQEQLLKNIETTTFWAIWIIVFASPIIAQNHNDDFTWRPVFFSWIKLIPFIILSTLNHFFLVPFLFFNKHKIIYFISVVVLVAAFATVNNQLRIKEDQKRSLARKEMRQQTSKKSKTESTTSHSTERSKTKKQKFYKRMQTPGALPPQINLIIVTLLILGFDLGLSTVFKWSQSEQERTKLEKEHLNTQLAFLRNQVSPHFFMNTLNNIHSLIDIDTNEAKDAVIQLSKLMRHLLYDSEAEKIPLQKEIGFIQHFIDLMRLRFTDKVKIDFQVDANMPDCSIPPLLFTSFLENAFKHGVSYQEESFINIHIGCSKNNLHFTIKNSNPKTVKDLEPSGIGMANSIKRLDLLYQNNYQLEVMDNSDAYIVNLTLPI